MIRSEYQGDIVSKIINEVFLHKDYVEVLIKKTGLASYEATVLLDIEDFPKLGKLRATASNYVYTCGVPSYNLSHLVMDHKSNMGTVVDHINGNPLDNRKANLRVVTQRDNANNRTTTHRNNTGVVGISYRSNNKYEYYRATISDRKTPMKGAVSKTKQISKQFNINKLGKELAFLQAKDWINAKKKEFGYI